MLSATFSLLHRRLSSLGFDGWDAVTEEDVYSGAPHCYAELMRAILFSFPHDTAALMRKYPWLCIEGEDGALAHSVLRLLSLEGSRRIVIKATQFGEKKYAAAKMNICIELFDLLSRLSWLRENTQGTRTAARRAALARAIPFYPAACDASAFFLKARLGELNGRRKALDHHLDRE
ncbi:hypothetical protein TcYC6_0127890 [Trypanosoma cruzi]|nr:hypothetical protein TcYC6_0127890 [Trypanosoma cruzi]